MEYFRQPKNRIQAGIALRAGKLLVQYDNITSNIDPHEKYDATLIIAVLQLILTNCAQLLKEMTAQENKLSFFSNPLPDIAGIDEISKLLITKNTFDNELTYGFLIECMRNALSHPTVPDKGTESSTGYSTVLDGTEKISTFIFTDSPWVKRGNLETYSDSDKAQGVIRGAINKGYSKVGLTAHLTKNGKYKIQRGSNTYYPCLTVEIPLKALKNFAINIANILAQPAMDDWDGKTIHDRVA